MPKLHSSFSHPNRITDNGACSRRADVWTNEWIDWISCGRVDIPSCGSVGKQADGLTGWRRRPEGRMGWCYDVRADRRTDRRMDRPASCRTVARVELAGSIDGHDVWSVNGYTNGRSSRPSNRWVTIWYLGDSVLETNRELWNCKRGYHGQVIVLGWFRSGEFAQ